MAMSKLVTMAAVVAAVSVFAGTIKLAVAQQSSDVVGELANNEGIFVDGKTFKIVRGAAKGDPSAEIAKFGAQESPGQSSSDMRASSTRPQLPLKCCKP